MSHINEETLMTLPELAKHLQTMSGSPYRHATRKKLQAWARNGMKVVVEGTTWRRSCLAWVREYLAKLASG